MELEEKETIETPEKNDQNTVQSETDIAENLAFLEMLLTDKKEKAKDYEKVKKNIQSLIASEGANRQRFGVLVKIILKAEVAVVKAFYEQEWNNFSDENREAAFNEVLNMIGDKAVTRQSAAASAIAAKDGEKAARLIFQILGGSRLKKGHFDFSSISKDRKDTLRSRFFLPNSNWSKLTTTDPEINRTIALFFWELANENKDFGTGSSVGQALNLSRWMINLLDSEKFDADSGLKIETQLNRIIKRLPPNAQEDLNKLKNSLPVQINNTESHSDKTDESSTENTTETETETINHSEKTTENTEKALDEDAIKESKKFEENKGSSPSKNNQSEIESRKNSNSQSASAPKKNSPKISDLSSPEQLLKEKQLAQMQLASEIDILAKLIEERDSLQTSKRNLQNKLSDTEDELEKTETKLQKLRRNFDDIENELIRTTREKEQLLANQKKLSDELAETQQQLQSAKGAVESERTEFARNSEREVELKLAGLKGEIKRKLEPIFENKRGTDNNPSDEKLAEFLRDQFLEIENALKKSGIVI